jgi:hypothetical protein
MILKNIELFNILLRNSFPTGSSAGMVRPISITLNAVERPALINFESSMRSIGIAFPSS